MNSLIDAHAHLTHAEADAVQQLLQRAKEANVEAIINVCCDLDDLLRGLKLAESSQNPKVYTVAALTPHDAAKDDTAFFQQIKKCISEKKLVAIGETGLDYYYNHAPKEVQMASFARYRDLAQEHNLPIVIHCRDAFDDVCNILDPLEKVMLHCFTGTVAEAERALERGWYISLSGIVTFPKSTGLQEVAKMVPLDRLLIETDSPYLAPQGYRGQKNEPSFLVATAKIVAALKGISVAALAEATTKNVKRLFHGIS